MSDRLTALDSSFLHLEDDSAHMHVASVMIFDGDPPSHEELLESIERRLHLVPRYRQRLAFVPLAQARPRWVDDPHLNLGYHVRVHRAAVPGLRGAAARPGGPGVRPAAGSRQAAVGGLAGGGPGGRAVRDALQDPSLARGRDLRRGHPQRAVRHLAGARRADRTRAARWLPQPVPSRAQLLGRGADRARHHARRGRARRAGGVSHPAPDRRARWWAPPPAWARWPGPACSPAPTTPYNKPIGPHRRFTWVRTNLADMKAIKNELGGTVNDVVLAIGGRRAGTPSAPPRRAHRRPGAHGHGAGERAQRRPARRPRQPGGGDHGPAAGLVPGAGGAPGRGPRGDGRTSRRAARRWAPRCSPA